MSKPTLQAIRGTNDLFFEEAARYATLIQKARDVAALYNFRECFTPVFEYTEVFKRTLGETSDVVSKEMYTFEDRNGESMTLRPEFTAGIARAFITNGMQQHLPMKCFSAGPLFRYERPQKGRYRQFTQVNFEWLGAADTSADVELIAMGARLLQQLGIEGETLELNSLGDAESRAHYTAVLVEYLSKFKAELSEDSQQRLQKNPLRILDSKSESDQKILQSAPKLASSYSDTAKRNFDAIQSGLTTLNIAFNVNPNIVRGLDYYNDVVFEFTAHNPHVGAQNTVLAGGRYDNLISTMGGAATPALGFAAGVERLLLMAQIAPATHTPVAMIVRDESEMPQALQVAEKLRKVGFSIELIQAANIGKGFKKAEKIGAQVFVILKANEPLEIKANAGYEALAEKVKTLL